MSKEAANCPFIFTGTTIEVERNLPGASYEYERACLYWLAARLAQNDRHVLLIGARMTEQILNMCRLSRYAKPDIMVFRNGSSCWQLNELVEVKSVRPSGVQKKLSGFSDLLRKLRRKPSLLVGSLSRLVSTEDLCQLPSQIIVPVDQQVEVTFISPMEYQQQELFPTSFRVSFVQY